MKLNPEFAYQFGYQIRDLIRDKEVSCQEVVRFFFNRIEEKNPKLNAYNLLLEKEALKQAKYLDKHLDKHLNDKLLGIPISIKDLLIHIKGHVTTNGSLLCKAMLQTEDSLAVENLREQGAIFLGKTAASEFGSSYMTQSKLSAPTLNPWDLLCTSGGSSGGSASAVAGGLCSITLANDSAGSIRLPSSFCSLFGFMPSSSQVPVTTPEEKDLAPLNRLGPISRCVKDAAIMLDTINRQTQLDINQKPTIDFEAAMEKTPKKLKLGFSPDLDFGLKDPQTIAIIEKRLLDIESLGHKVEPFKMPFDVHEHVDLMTDLIVSKFKELVDRVPKIARALLSEPLVYILERAEKIDDKKIHKAQKFREKFHREIHSLYKNYDLLITPTCVSSAFKVKDYPKSIHPFCQDPFLFFAFLLYPFNMSGQPAASLPCGFNKKQMPIGMQVIGAEDRDELLFSFCSQYEKEFPWHENYLTLVDL